MAPEVGLEPTTNRLTADRSTTELLRNGREVIYIEGFKSSKLFCLISPLYRSKILSLAILWGNGILLPSKIKEKKKEN